jgi:hypothetical protein
MERGFESLCRDARYMLLNCLPVTYQPRHCVGRKDGRARNTMVFSNGTLVCLDELLIPCSQIGPGSRWWLLLIVEKAEVDGQSRTECQFVK